MKTFLNKIFLVYLLSQGNSFLNLTVLFLWGPQTMTFQFQGRKDL